MASSDPSCNARMLSYMNVSEPSNGSVSAGSKFFVTAGLQPQSVNFTRGCGGFGILHNANLYHGNETATANVVKINAINDHSGGVANTFVTLSNCDGTSVLNNITTPGVYVVKGQATLIVVKRRNVNGANASDCPAGSEVLFELESLERYCGLGYSAPECKTTTAISPATPAYKRSMVVTLFTACVALAASALA